MNVHGKHYRTIWLKEDDPSVVQIIDQRHLPHRFVIEDLSTVDDVARAIADMHVRGAGLIGATAGFGMYIAALQAPRTSPENFMDSCRRFAVESGLATERAMKLAEEAIRAGAVGATQNMIGEAVHALVHVDALENVLSTFRRFVPEERILVAEICLQGARLVG